jgi:hypothetical protein
VALLASFNKYIIRLRLVVEIDADSEILTVP